jgi:hypothetical protein
MIVVFDGNNRNGRICRIWGFGRKRSANRGSEVHDAKNNDNENPEIAICDFAI